MFHEFDRRRPMRALIAGAGLMAILAGCTTDPQGRINGMRLPWDNTGGNAAQPVAAPAQPRPQPDQQGVISFPSFQVVVARVGDTASSIAQRLGIDTSRFARHNAVDPNAPLDQGAVLTLPGGRGGSVQVTDPYAGQGVRQPSVPGMSGNAAATAPAAPAAAATPTGPDPRQHRVVAGETAWSIARKYGVTVQDLASWNGLPEAMTVRTGQLLTIPVAGRTAPSAAVTAPGTGSVAPEPPSAATPLPGEQTRPAASPAPATPTPDLGATRTASSGARFAMPVSGPIARAYKKGTNEGIDIRTDPGATVKAAGSGTVAAITRDTSGVPIVVIRHEGELMTVYAGIDALTVNKGDRVSAGQSIGKAAASGLVHFEVRQGYNSVDPADYL